MMYRKYSRVLLFFSFFVLFSAVSKAQLEVQHLLAENLVNPIAIDESHPQFSWSIASEKRDVMQTAYEIRVSENEPFFKKAKASQWISGKINSDRKEFQ